MWHAQIREDLQGPYSAMLEQARRVGKVAADCKLALDVEDYVATFRPDLMEGVSAWFRGATFAEVLKSTEIFEVGGLLVPLGSPEALLHAWCAP